MFLQYRIMCLACIVHFTMQTTTEKDSPEIRIESSANWKSMVISIINQNAYYAPHYDASLRVVCAAQFPVQWNISGVSSRLISPNFHYDHRKTPKSYLSSFEFENISGDVYLHVTCEKIGNTNVSEGIGIFVSAKFNRTLVAPLSLQFTNFNLIPCPTTNPSLEVELYRSDEKGIEKRVGELDKTLQYIPWEGFRSEKQFEGLFTCRQNASTVTVNVSKSDFWFYPQSDSVKASEKDFITLKCRAKKGYQVEIFVNDSVTLFYPVISETMNMGAFNYEEASNLQKCNISVVRKYDSDTVTVLISWNYTKFKAKIKGLAACMYSSLNRNDTRTIKKWSFEIMKSPEIQIDNYAREFQCLSWYPNVKARTLFCKNSLECSFKRSHCPKNLAACVFYSHSKRKCFTSSEYVCTSISYTYPGGLIECVVDEIVKQWEFFESLKGKMFLDWKMAPIEELIRLDEAPFVLYTNETNQFTCEMVQYLLVSVPKFILEFKNGSKVFIYENGVDVNISMYSIHNDLNHRLISNLNYIWTLNINLPIDAVALHCYGVLQNSTEGLVATRLFEMKYMVIPRLTQNNTDISKPIEFNVNKALQSLSCHADGEPPLEYTWYFNGSKVEDFFPKFKSIQDSRKGRLMFPEIQLVNKDKYTGEYLCVAHNRVGSVTQTFRVNWVSLKLESSSERDYSAIFISIGVVGGSIVVTLIGALGLYIRKYRKSKKKLSLAEVDLFFHGSPDLVKGGIIPETMEYMPYNPVMEIPMENLKIEFGSNKKFGGSNVYRGVITTMGLSVAVKVAGDKSSLKSLFSEIKMLLYIGSHENVLTMIGACAKNVHKGFVYLVLELCEKGSLHSFLHELQSCPFTIKSLSAGTGHVEQYQDENCSACATFDDLLSFCVQIANGMEYLAYKRIIHADLAAKNILLTNEMTVKISGFGMSRRLYNYDPLYYHSELLLESLSLRWMALESLKTCTFSMKSDVWSYGVTLYEIFSLGIIPYAEETSDKEIIKRLEEGMRLEKPTYCNEEIYLQILDCFENDPKYRPDFGSLRIYFENMRNKKLNKFQDSGFCSETVPKDRETYYEYYAAFPM